MARRWAGGLQPEREAPPCLAGWQPWAQALGWPAAGALHFERANALAVTRDCRSGSGQPLRFVPAPALAEPRLGYETIIFDRGQVPTRTMGRGGRHDFANALAWLSFPRLKARLNALHVEALPAGNGSGQRGRLRDRATLFDESGALVLTEDAASAELLHQFNWSALFLDRREDWRDRIRVVITGHALIEKLCAPYKSICAQALVLHASPAAAPDAVDALAAHVLCPEALQSLTPLPLMGIPGWSPANHDPAFYNDRKVFRTGRQR